MGGVAMTKSQAKYLVSQSHLSKDSYMQESRNQLPIGKAQFLNAMPQKRIYFNQSQDFRERSKLKLMMS